MAAMDQHFLDVISRLGYQDGQCNKIVFGEAVKELTKPGERIMYDMLRDMLSKVSLYIISSHLPP